jgi:hypothetical protein
VFDILNREVDSRNFFLSIDVTGSPRTPPPAKPIATFINAQLARLDPDTIAVLWNSGDPTAVPTWHFNHEGLQIQIRPIPKKPEARGKPSSGPIGSLSTGMELVDHKTPIRESIIQKGGRYGHVDLPFIVAVNVLELIDDFDVMQALFGTEQWPIVAPARLGDDPHLGPLFRLRDGAWIDPGGPRYTRISAALIVSRLTEYTAAKASARLYHNPWALQPVTEALKRLPQAVPVNGAMQHSEGERIGAILGLSPDWPIDEE